VNAFKWDKGKTIIQKYHIMLQKKILGLDLGSNSIGTALVTVDESGYLTEINHVGSRIIPTSGKVLNEFSAGKPSKSASAERRGKRQIRRGLQRYSLRRDNLKRALTVLGIIPRGLDNLFLEKNEPVGAGNHLHFETEPFEKKNFQYKPFDLYELRYRALTEKIPLEDLARIWYQFLQRRGFKSGRKTKTDDDVSDLIYREVEIISVTDSGKKVDKTDKIIWNVTIQKDFEGLGTDFTTLSQVIKNFVNKSVFVELVKARGEHLPTIKLPDPTKWAARKNSLELRYKESGLPTPGAFLYAEYLACKAKGQEFLFKARQNIWLRSQLENEFSLIWKEQVKHHPILSDRAAYLKVLEAVLPKHYPGRNQWQSEDKNLGLFIQNYVVFYQRSLRSVNTGDCSLERYFYQDKDAAWKNKGISVCPKHNPVFEAFRIWKQIHNLRLYDEYKKEIVVEDSIKEKLFEILNQKEQLEVVEKTGKNEIISSLSLDKRYTTSQRKSWKGAETKANFRSFFNKHNYKTEGAQILANPIWYEALWHKVHSIEDDKLLKNALLKDTCPWSPMPDALAKDLSELNLGEGFGSYSRKALEKINSLMAVGKYGVASEDDLPPFVAKRVQEFRKYIETGDDSELKIKLEEASENRLIDLANKGHLLGLQEHDATALLYGDRNEVERYEKPEDVKLLPKNSLRQPIVEQVINETLRVVRDLWKATGTPPDEIRVELSRDLQNDKKTREKIFERNNDAEKKNVEITKKIEEIFRVYYPNQQRSGSDIDRFRLWAETFDPTKVSPTPNKKESEDYQKWLTETDPEKIKVNASLVEKFKLWQEAGHCSPYTGKKIPLSRLFTSEYQIEHIIPKTVMYNNGFMNKTICEADINKEKGDSTAHHYICKRGGTTLPGRTTLSWEAFQEAIKVFPTAKQRYFLMENIPDDFISRQLNETRYISKRIIQELEKIVPTITVVEKGKEVRKRKVTTTVGMITDYLREQWGMNKLMKELQKPRYQALAGKEGLDEEILVRYVDKKVMEDKKESIITVLELEDYSKRKDHRHHAIDALVVACTRQSIVKQLNDLNKIKQQKGERLESGKRTETGKEHKDLKVYQFQAPHPNFYAMAKKAIEEIAVSIQTQTKLVDHAQQHRKGRDAEGKEKWVTTNRTTFTSVRGSLHEDSHYGRVPTKIEVEKTIKEAFEMPNNVVNLNIKEAILERLEEYKGDSTLAFSSLKKNPLIVGGVTMGTKVFLWEKVFRFVKRKNLENVTSTDVINIQDRTLRDEILLFLGLPQLTIDTLIGGALKKALESVLKEKAKEKESEEDKKEDKKEKTIFNAETVILFNEKRMSVIQNKKGQLPVYKVRVFDGSNAEIETGKVAIRKSNHNKQGTWVTKGDNYLTAVFEKEINGQKEREFISVSLFDAATSKNKTGDIEDYTQHKLVIEDGFRFLFTISKKDTFYLPRLGEKIENVDWNNKKSIAERLFLLQQMSGTNIYFRPLNISSEIILKKDKTNKQKDSQEFVAKMGGMIMYEGKPIRDNCIKVSVDSLGKITLNNS
jgi:CRISPR-associated endonuclease Csn1